MIIEIQVLESFMFKLNEETGTVRICSETWLAIEFRDSLSSWLPDSASGLPAQPRPSAKCRGCAAAVRDAWDGLVIHTGEPRGDSRNHCVAGAGEARRR